MSAVAHFLLSSSPRFHGVFLSFFFAGDEDISHLVLGFKNGYRCGLDGVWVRLGYMYKYENELLLSYTPLQFSHENQSHSHTSFILTYLDLIDATVR